jgi:hypothetical protein
LGGVFLLFVLELNVVGGGQVRGLRGGGRGGGVRSGTGAARTILLFHTISARPSKHVLFLQEQIKDIIIISLVWWEVPLGYIGLG